MMSRAKWKKNRAKWGRSYRKRRLKLARWLLSHEWLQEAIEPLPFLSETASGPWPGTIDDLGRRQRKDLPYDTPPRLRPGLSIVGYLCSEIGLGHAARGLAYAADSARIPSSFCNLPLPGRENEPEFFSKCVPLPDRKASMLVFGLPSITRLVDEIRGGRHNILYPYWELSGIDQEWLRVAERFNEVWAPTNFIADAFRAQSRLPVTVVPQPVRVARNLLTARTSRDPGDPLRFLTYFDYDSFGERKNPKATVNAFRSAFPKGSEDVTLVVKTRGEQDNGLRGWLAKAAATDRRITVIDRTVDRDTIERLMFEADVFVSLHRSEGFGFGAAEALAAGTAVIATDYSGTRDLIDETTGYPITYKLIPVGKDEYVATSGQYWADADLDAAVVAMQAIYDAPQEAKLRVERGRTKVLSEFSPEAIGRQIHSLLAERGLL